MGGFVLEHLGELASLGAALCWVFTSLAFAAAGRRVGPTIVNVTRLFIALFFLAIIHRMVFSTWIPPVDAHGLWLLALSGLIGLAIGDQFLFTALVDVGSRMTTLMMTLAPPIAAIIAWPMLDESLRVLSIAGMLLTLGGIAWVVMERPGGTGHVPHRHRARGIVFGLLAAACQGIGLVLAKLGIGHTRVPAEQLIDPWSATLVRMAFGTIGIVIFAFVMRLIAGRRADQAMAISPEAEHLPEDLFDGADGQAFRAAGSASRASATQAARQRTPIWPGAIVLIVIGAVFGPVLGVWFSLVGVDRAEAGIAATLMAMTPVFILPFAALIEKERITWRAVIGAIIAVAGVAVLTLSNGP